MDSPKYHAVILFTWQVVTELIDIANGQKWFHQWIVLIVTNSEKKNPHRWQLKPGEHRWDSFSSAELLPWCTSQFWTSDDQLAHTSVRAWTASRESTPPRVQKEKEAKVKDKVHEFCARFHCSPAWTTKLPVLCDISFHGKLEVVLGHIVKQFPRSTTLFLWFCTCMYIFRTENRRKGQKGQSTSLPPSWGGVTGDIRGGGKSGGGDISPRGVTILTGNGEGGMTSKLLRAFSNRAGFSLLSKLFSPDFSRILFIFQTILGIIFST